MILYIKLNIFIFVYFYYNHYICIMIRDKFKVKCVMLLGIEKDYTSNQR